MQKNPIILITLLLLVACTIVWATEIDQPEPKPTQSAVGQQINQAATSPRTGEQINWQVISAGATDASSTNYGLKGTTGQTSVGAGSSTNYGVSHGFWQETGGGGCCVIRGDVDHSGVPPVDIADLVYLVDFMFNAGPVPDCFDEGDVDASGVEPIDIADLVYLVDFMFNAGPIPPPCP